MKTKRRDMHNNKVIASGIFCEDGVSIHNDLEAYRSFNHIPGGKNQRNLIQDTITTYSNMLRGKTGLIAVISGAFIPEVGFIFLGIHNAVNFINYNAFRNASLSHCIPSYRS